MIETLGRAPHPGEAGIPEAIPWDGMPLLYRSVPGLEYRCWVDFWVTTDR
jgi:hypothetical protein